MTKSAYLTGIKSFKVQDEKNIIQNYAVRIKVDSCAICGSDIRIFNKGNERIQYPAVIGHEVSGTIVESNFYEYEIGERISLGADIPCGSCDKCKNNQPNLCKKNLAIGYQLKGGFTEFMELDQRVFDLGPVVRLSAKLSTEVACLGEPLACAINGVEKMHMKQKTKTAIFGAGPIGIMIGYLCKKIYQCDDLLFIEPNDQRRQSLKSLDIADKIIDIGEINEKYFAKYDYVFTACSVLETHSIGIKMLDNGGSINFFGGLAKPAPGIEIITNELHYKELTLTGSHGSTPTQHKKALSVIEEDQDFFKSLITHRFTLENIEQAFEKASSGSGIKVLIKP